MADFSNLTTTNSGKALISGDLSGRVLSFDKMTAGSGTIVDDTHIPPMTAVVAPQLDMPITRIIDNGDGTVTLTGVISSSKVTTGFNFTELGIFATLDGANETLFCYANAYAEYDYIPGSGESSQVVNSITVTIIVDTNASVTCVIGDSSQIDAENIGTPSVGAGWYAQKTGTILQFKRAVAGVGVLIAETANTITIGQKALGADLTLYVAPGNPDISPNFSTIPNAIAYLKGFRIPALYWANINVSGDTYNHSGTTVTVDHIDATRIKLMGAAGKNTPLTAITNSGANIIATVASNTGLYVGQMVYLTGNPLAGPYRGGHNILAINGNQITMERGLGNGNDYTTNQAGLTVCQLCWFPTVIKGAFTFTYGIGQFNNFTVSPGSYVFGQGQNNYAISVFGPAYLFNLFTYHSYMGLNIANAQATVLAGEIILANGTYGLTISRAANCNAPQITLYINNAASGLDMGGASAQIGTYTGSASGSANIIGCNSGFDIEASASLNIGNCFFMCCKNGAISAANGVLIMGVGPGGSVGGMTPLFNTLDLYAGNGGYISYSQSGVGIVPTCSPPAGVIGNDFSYIRVGV